jgi:hypothetical protein
MVINLSKWASPHRKIAKSGHRVAAEPIPFRRWWHGRMISVNLEAIWGMSDISSFGGRVSLRWFRLKLSGKCRITVLDQKASSPYCLNVLRLREESVHKGLSKGSF